ncbi:MAG: hypothetical protein H6706_18825 [Myxococcales bacterium]|nr:hypothetical protein [Myxococcales bacterium]
MTAVIGVQAAAVVTDLAAARAAAPAVWRDVRRYDPPAQAALFAAYAVLGAERAGLALVALAPCQAGSPEMFAWVRRIAAGEPVRMNPLHTLHAVDNLALSALSLGLGAQGHGTGLGGAPGQWGEGLALLLARLRAGPEVEGLLLAGDQADAEAGGAVFGAALRLGPGPGQWRLDAVERWAAPATPARDATAGLRAFIAWLAAPGTCFEAPAATGDGQTATRLRGAPP